MRSNVREFGDNEYDQVDLSDLATLTKQSLSLGTEDDVQAAVQNMVVYNVTYEKVRRRHCSLFSVPVAGLLRRYTL